VPFMDAVFASAGEPYEIPIEKFSGGRPVVCHGVSHA
jgi:hypothetical protein